MYPNFPLIVTPPVRWIRDEAFAMPKSVSFTSPSKLTSTFCGETSRWTIASQRPSSSRFVWAYARPRRSPDSRWTTTSTGRPRPAGAARWSSSAASTPWTHSITMKSAPSASPKSSTPTTLGWRSCDAMRASSRNISTNSGPPSSRRMRLMQTSRETPRTPSRAAR